jgi:hypothetical protein
VEENVGGDNTELKSAVREKIQLQSVRAVQKEINKLAIAVPGVCSLLEKLTEDEGLKAVLVEAQQKQERVARNKWGIAENYVQGSNEEELEPEKPKLSLIDRLTPFRKKAG